jgi:hypothetical protein
MLSNGPGPPAADDVRERDLPGAEPVGLAMVRKEVAATPLLGRPASTRMMNYPRQAARPLWREFLASRPRPVPGL